MQASNPGTVRRSASSAGTTPEEIRRALCTLAGLFESPATAPDLTAPSPGVRPEEDPGQRRRSRSRRRRSASRSSRQASPSPAVRNPRFAPTEPGASEAAAGLLGKGRRRRTSSSAATRTTSWLSHVPVPRLLRPHQARQCPPQCQCRCRRPAHRPRRPRPPRPRQLHQRVPSRRGLWPRPAKGPDLALPAPWGPRAAPWRRMSPAPRPCRRAGGLSARPLPRPSRQRPGVRWGRPQDTRNRGRRPASTLSCDPSVRRPWLTSPPMPASCGQGAVFPG